MTVFTWYLLLTGRKYHFLWNIGILRQCELAASDLLQWLPTLPTRRQRVHRRSSRGVRCFWFRRSASVSTAIGRVCVLPRGRWIGRRPSGILRAEQRHRLERFRCMCSRGFAGGQCRRCSRGQHYRAVLIRVLPRVGWHPYSSPQRRNSFHHQRPLGSSLRCCGC